MYRFSGQGPTPACITLVCRTELDNCYLPMVMGNCSHY